MMTTLTWDNTSTDHVNTMNTKCYTVQQISPNIVFWMNLKDQYLRAQKNNKINGS